MSIRLGEYIVYGELWNTSHYTTHGYLVLRGENEDGAFSVRFEVTGDCAPDIQGKHIRFRPAEDDATQIPMPADLFKSINPTQHGVTGTVTAQGWVRALPCTMEEFMNRSIHGESPPTTWRNHFVFEWFGPSGRILVELAGAEVEYCVREPERDDEEDEGDWLPLENLAMPPDLDGPKPGSGPAIKQFELEDRKLRVQEIQPLEHGEKSRGDHGDLQDQLDAESERIDREIAGITDESADQAWEAMERMDYCMEHGEKVPFEVFIGDFSELPKAETLDDDAVEVALKSLLARLVTCGVVLDVCDHFTPRDCYRLLLEEILPEEGAYKELVGTGWITHYCTWEHCSACDAEMDERIAKGEFG